MLNLSANVIIMEASSNAALVLGESVISSSHVLELQTGCDSETLASGHSGHAFSGCLVRTIGLCVNREGCLWYLVQHSVHSIFPWQSWQI